MLSDNGMQHDVIAVLSSKRNEPHNPASSEGNCAACCDYHIAMHVVFVCAPVVVDILRTDLVHCKTQHSRKGNCFVPLY